MAMTSNYAEWTEADKQAAREYVQTHGEEAARARGAELGLDPTVIQQAVDYSNNALPTLDLGESNYSSQAWSPTVRAGVEDFVKANADDPLKLVSTLGVHSGMSAEDLAGFYSQVTGRQVSAQDVTDFAKANNLWVQGMDAPAAPRIDADPTNWSVTDRLRAEAVIRQNIGNPEQLLKLAAANGMNPEQLSRAIDGMAMADDLTPDLKAKVNAGQMSWQQARDMQIKNMRTTSPDQISALAKQFNIPMASWSAQGPVNQAAARGAIPGVEPSAPPSFEDFVRSMGADFDDAGRLIDPSSGRLLKGEGALDNLRIAYDQALMKDAQGRRPYGTDITGSHLARGYIPSTDAPRSGITGLGEGNDTFVGPDGKTYMRVGASRDDIANSLNYGRFAQYPKLREHYAPFVNDFLSQADVQHDPSKGYYADSDLWNKTIGEAMRTAPDVDGDPFLKEVLPALMATMGPAFMGISGLGSALSGAMSNAGFSMPNFGSTLTNFGTSLGDMLGAGEGALSGAFPVDAASWGVNPQFQVGDFWSDLYGDYAGGGDVFNLNQSVFSDSPGPQMYWDEAGNLVSGGASDGATSGGVGAMGSRGNPYLGAATGAAGAAGLPGSNPGTNPGGYSYPSLTSGGNGVTPSILQTLSNLGSGATNAVRSLFGGNGNAGLNLGGMNGPLALAMLAGLLENPDRTTTQKTEFPDWYTDFSKKAMAQADKIAGMGSDIVAPLSQNEQLAGQLAASTAGQWKPYLDRAASYLDRSATPMGAADINSYMNPYIDQVLQPVERKQQQVQAQRNATADAQAGMKSAFGTSRHALEKSLLRESGDAEMNRIRSDAYKSAYDYATARAADDKNRQANAGTSYGGLGTAFSNLAGGDISRLSSTGAAAREVDQARRAAPLAALNAFRNALPSNVNLTTTTVGPESSKMGQLTGALAALYGLS
jgi:hypothetical protein